MNNDQKPDLSEEQHHLHPPGDDFSVEAVPQEETVHGLRVALVLIGIAITIPAFLTGSELGLAMGLGKVAIAIPIGALFLCAIGCFAATIAAQSRLTTYMIIQFSFGSQGAKLVNLIISITIFGWFSVTASFFGESIQRAVSDIWGLSPNLSLLIIVGSGLVILTAVFGFKALDKLALMAVPLLFGALIWLVYLALGDTSIASLEKYSNDAMTLGQGITAVIGGFIVGAVIMPDYCRYVRNTAQNEPYAGSNPARCLTNSSPACCKPPSRLHQAGHGKVGASSSFETRRPRTRLESFIERGMDSRSRRT